MFEIWDERRGNEDKSKCQAPARFNICRTPQMHLEFLTILHPAHFKNINIESVLERSRLALLSSAFNTRGGGGQISRQNKTGNEFQILTDGVCFVKYVILCQQR